MPKEVPIWWEVLWAAIIASASYGCWFSCACTPCGLCGYPAPSVTRKLCTRQEAGGYTPGRVPWALSRLHIPMLCRLPEVVELSTSITLNYASCSLYLLIDYMGRGARGHAALWCPALSSVGLWCARSRLLVVCSASAQKNGRDVQTP